MQTLILLSAVLASAFGQYYQYPGQYQQYPSRYDYYETPITPRPIWRVKPTRNPYRQPVLATISPTIESVYEGYTPTISSNLVPPISSTFAPDYFGSTVAPPVISSTLAPIVVPSRHHHNHPERFAGTLQRTEENDGFGNYHYSYETENGISARQTGTQKVVDNHLVPQVQGSYSWVSPEGKVISISYYSDETGYHASGDAIPTPPPTPDYVLRTLALIKARQQAGQQPEYQYYKKK